MENTTRNNKIIARKKGIVAEDKADKTVIVSVDVLKAHKKYKKKFKFTKRYKVHDEDNKYKIGDTVEIIPCRPVSKDKKYKVVAN